MDYWSKRFLTSTRGRIVRLLLRSEATVNDLAGAFGLTDNTIRTHLTTLERDGLVQQAGKRPGVRKPETIYTITPEAERLFPKAYHLLLNQLLDVLNEQLPPGEIEELLRHVGRKIAMGHPIPTPESNLGNRVKEAQEVLNSLGGLAELEEHNGRFVIRGYRCPFAATVERHPEVCQLAEALLGEIIGITVQEKCNRNGAPRCVFEIR